MNHFPSIGLDALSFVTGGAGGTAAGQNPRSPTPAGAPAPTSGPTTGDRVRGCLGGALVSGLGGLVQGGPWRGAAAAVGGCIAGAIQPSGGAH